MIRVEIDAILTEPQLTERLVDVLEPREEILEAYLFGSHARGQAQRHSDVDVAVYVDAAKADDSGFGYRAYLTTELMAGLGSNDVDVVVLNRAPPLLYHRVLRDGVRLFFRELRATTTREGRAVSRYCDFVPQLAKMEAARRVAGGARPVSPGRPDSQVVRRHLAALREALSHLRRHAGSTPEMLRALINNPKILLLDEPFRAMDTVSKSTMHQHLLDIYDQFRKTVSSSNGG